MRAPTNGRDKALAAALKMFPPEAREDVVFAVGRMREGERYDLGKATRTIAADIAACRAAHKALLAVRLVPDQNSWRAAQKTCHATLDLLDNQVRRLERQRAIFDGLRNGKARRTKPENFRAEAAIAAANQLLDRYGGHPSGRGRVNYRNSLAMLLYAAATGKALSARTIETYASRPAR